MTTTLVANAPPDVTIPTPPTGFTEPNMLAFRGMHPSQGQLAAVLDAIRDLGNFADYAAVLSTSAPPATQVAEALSVGLGWRMLRDPSEAWATYVRAEDAIAWKTALTLLDQLKPLFLIAMTNNPKLATMYPGLAAMFDAAKLRAKQASTTRKKNAKTKAATAATAATAAAVTAATEAAKVAAPVAAPVAAVAPKAVMTVNAS